MSDIKTDRRTRIERPAARPPPSLAATTSEGGNELADLHSAPPVAVGTAMHHVMDHIALDGSEDPGPLVRAACLEAGIPGAEAELSLLVRECLASPVLRRAVASPSVHREVPFMVPAPSGGYAVGRVDLVFREDDGLVIVDYKSDHLPDGEASTIAAAAQAHVGQGLVYAAALEQSTGLRVSEVVFVFARAGGEHRIAIDDAAREAGRELLGSGRTLGAE